MRYMQNQMFDFFINIVSKYQCGFRNSETSKNPRY